MCNGIVLVDKIDILTKELGISRKDFANQLDINPSTIATWRTRNILPPMETIEAIAKYFTVSIEWLVSEDSTSQLFDALRTKSSRKAIRSRIYETIFSKSSFEKASHEELHLSFFEDMPELTFRFLYNWAEGRININEYVFEEIAFKLGVSLDYLIGGSKKEEELDNQDKVCVSDDMLFRKAKRNSSDVLKLDRLSGERKKIVSDMLSQLVKLEDLKLICKDKIGYPI